MDLMIYENDTDDLKTVTRNDAGEILRLEINCKHACNCSLRPSMSHSCDALGTHASHP